MKDKLGIEKECENCYRWESCIFLCKGNPCRAFSPSKETYEARIKELQEIEFENKLEKSHLQKEIEKAYDFISKLKEKLVQQFTNEEAEKIETFLTHGYQMIISKNKKIFSKLEKMKGE